MKTTFGRFAASAMHDLVLHLQPRRDVGVVVVGDADPDQRAVVAAEVVHRRADPLAVLRAPIGVIATGAR